MHQPKLLNVSKWSCKCKTEPVLTAIPRKLHRNTRMLVKSNVLKCKVFILMPQELHKVPTLDDTDNTVALFIRTMVACSTCKHPRNKTRIKLNMATLSILVTVGVSVLAKKVIILMRKLPFKVLYGSLTPCRQQIPPT